MPTISQISETAFRDTISRAVQDVFKTMLNRVATLSLVSEPIGADSKQDPTHIHGSHVVGTVGFIGEITGLVYVYLEAGFADTAAGHMLGMNQAEIADAGYEVVNDVVGELTNMTVGAFKNQLADKGFPCRLTIPSILRGDNFKIEPTKSATRRIFRFMVDDSTVLVDLLMQNEDQK